MLKRQTLVGAAALGVIGALAVIGTATVTDYLLKLAVDRQRPPVPKAVWSRVNPPDGMPSAEQMDSFQRRMLDLPQKTVRIRSRDGLKLVGHWLPTEGATRTLLMMHGWRSSWLNDFCGIVPFLQDCGCNMLLVEQRGQGESEGAHIGFGVLEQHDCLDWVDALRRQICPTLPIYLVGVSMGATTVLMASGHPLPEQVRGIVADCAFTSPAAIIASCLKAGFPKARQDILPLLNLAVRRRAGYRLDAYSTQTALRDNTKPVLFIHGEADTFVPVTMTLENYRACRAPKELLLVEGAGHGLSYVFDHEAYQTALKTFFSRYDAKQTV